MEKITNNNTKKRGNPQYLRPHPPWKPGESGNPKGRPKGTVRRWDAVMRQFFNLVQNEPEKIEKLTGLRVPESISGRDAQLLLVQQEYYKAIKGDGRAMAEIMERMDGKPDQNLNVKTNSIVELIQGGNKATQDAKAEAGDKDNA